MKYYYDIDNDGNVKAKYNRKQKDKELYYIEEPKEKGVYTWTGKKWKIDLSKYSVLKLNELREKIYSNWLDTGKSTDEITSQFLIWKSTTENAKTKTDIDNLYNQALQWLNV